VPQEQRHRRKYRRWAREAPMHLWPDGPGRRDLPGQRPRMQDGHRDRWLLPLRGDRAGPAL